MIPKRTRHAGWWFLPVAGLAASSLTYVGAAGPATTDVGADSAASPVPPDVRAACAQCHALPPPDSLPREDWQKAIYLMKGLALQGVGAPLGGPPPIVDFDLKRIVGYYESAAPESLPSPEPWPAAEGQTRFAHRPFRAGPSPLSRRRS